MFDFVGQFIHIVRPARKIFGQQIPGFCDALKEAQGEETGAQEMGKM